MGRKTSQLFPTLIVILLFSQFASAGIGIFRSTTISKEYTPAEIETLIPSKRAAVAGGVRFVIDNGRIFYQAEANQPFMYAQGTQDTRQILNYKDNILFLKSNGELYLLDENSLGAGIQFWTPLGRSVVDVATDQVDLFLLTQHRAFFTRSITHNILVYRGQSGDENWTYSRVRTPGACFQEFCSPPTYAPTLGNRPIAFIDLQIQHVNRLITQDGLVYAESTSGGDSRIELSRR